ncbi:hypothetical protein BH11MYX3_BH11MYX3_20270 [soil metagenome]
MRSTAALLVLLLGAGTVHAEKDYQPWYKGERGKKRILHISISAAVGLVWLASQTVAKDALSPDTCRWCTAPSIDRSARNAVVWNNTDRAGLYSTIDAYIVAPVIGLTLLAISDRDASWGRLLDDTIPVAETVAISQLLTQAIKFSVGRRRPYKEFGDQSKPYTTEENLSFTSGHASLGFAITASAGIICHWRHYWTEPYVWGTGIALSVTTEYLRMAADKHYLTDVVAGGLVGLGSGLLIPRLMRQDIKIAPIPGGAAVVGMF